MSYPTMVWGRGSLLEVVSRRYLWVMSGARSGCASLLLGCCMTAGRWEAGPCGWRDKIAQRLGQRRRHRSRVRSVEKAEHILAERRPDGEARWTPSRDGAANEQHWPLIPKSRQWTMPPTWVCAATTFIGTRPLSSRDRILATMRSRFGGVLPWWPRRRIRTYVLVTP